MNTVEIITIILGTLSLLGGMLYVWINNNIKIANLEVALKLGLENLKESNSITLMGLHKEVDMKLEGVRAEIKLNLEAIRRETELKIKSIEVQARDIGINLSSNINAFIVDNKDDHTVITAAVKEINSTVNDIRVKIANYKP